MRKLIKRKRIIKKVVIEEHYLYYCNFCKASLRGKKHLSIAFGGWSGWVEQNKAKKWKFINNAWRPWNVESVKQFCDGLCLERYFERKR